MSTITTLRRTEWARQYQETHGKSYKDGYVVVAVPRSESLKADPDEIEGRWVCRVFPVLKDARVWRNAHQAQANEDGVVLFTYGVGVLLRRRGGAAAMDEYIAWSCSAGLAP